MTDTPCATAIRNLAAGKIAEATLPATCTVAEAAAALAGLAQARDATGTLGTDRVQVQWRAIDTGIAGVSLESRATGEAPSPGSDQPLRNATVTPSPPSLCSPGRNLSTAWWLLR